jgi:hypothetical protein
MKTIANRIFQCAAGAVLLTASAFAQSNMTASIPFAFHANGVNMPAGTYRLDATSSPSGSTLIVLRDSAAKNAVVAVAGTLGSNPANRGARIVFRCQENGCDLRQVWTNETGYSYPGHGKDRSDDRLASIPLTNVKAD